MLHEHFIIQCKKNHITQAWHDVKIHCTKSDLNIVSCFNLVLLLSNRQSSFVM